MLIWIEFYYMVLLHFNWWLKWMLDYLENQCISWCYCWNCDPFAGWLVLVCFFLIFLKCQVDLMHFYQFFLKNSKTFMDFYRCFRKDRKMHVFLAWFQKIRLKVWIFYGFFKIMRKKHCIFTGFFQTFYKNSWKIWKMLKMW